MPMLTTGPEFPTESEEVRGKSWFHWCPNTHLHSRRRMHSVYYVHRDTWGKSYKILKGWTCMTCGIHEYPGLQN